MSYFYLFGIVMQQHSGEWVERESIRIDRLMMASSYRIGYGIVQSEQNNKFRMTESGSGHIMKG